MDYEKPVKKDSSKGEFSVGKKVVHPHWGRGIIKTTDGNSDNLKITVQFPGIGQKKLAVKYASLKAVEN